VDNKYIITAADINGKLLCIIFGVHVKDIVNEKLNGKFSDIFAYV